MTNNTYDNIDEVQKLVDSIISDPKAELRLLMTVLAQKLSYEATKGIVCLIARGELGSELDKRVTGSSDAALLLGIKNGEKGLSFSQSNVFGDKESLEFVVDYSINVPLAFGLIPELHLSNKVKIIAWTGGRGASVKENEEKTSSSIWIEMDQEQRYWDRGLEIEDIHVDKIVEERKSKGFEAYPTDKTYPVVDAFAYEKAEGIIECYDVFTLNPFLKTYTTNPKQIGYEIKKHGKRLLEFDRLPDNLNGTEIKKVKRTVVFIVPENSDAKVDEIYENAKKDLKKYDVEVIMIRDYGTYSEPVKEVQKVKILVSTRNINQGEEIKAQDIDSIDVSEDSLPAGIVNDRKNIEGFLANEKIIIGEPFRQERLAKKEEMTLSYTIPDGMRAISVFVNENNIFSTQLQVWDSVDVIGNFKKESMGGITIASSMIIIQNVEVLAIGPDRFTNNTDKIELSDEEKNLPRTVTLCVTPGDAEKMAFTTAFGDYALALRGYKDDKKVNTPGTLIEHVTPF